MIAINQGGINQHSLQANICIRNFEKAVQTGTAYLSRKGPEWFLISRHLESPKSQDICLLWFFNKLIYECVFTSFIRPFAFYSPSGFELMYVEGREGQGQPTPSPYGGDN
jgi:hypothetical protein